MPTRHHWNPGGKGFQRGTTSPNRTIYSWYLNGMALSIPHSFFHYYKLNVYGGCAEIIEIVPWIYEISSHFNPEGRKLTRQISPTCMITFLHNLCHEWECAYVNRIFDVIVASMDEFFCSKQPTFHVHFCTRYHQRNFRILFYGGIYMTPIFFGGGGLCRSHDIICRAHDTLSRAHRIISRAQDIFSRAYDVISVAHNISYIYHLPIPGT